MESDRKMYENSNSESESIPELYDPVELNSENLESRRTQSRTSKSSRRSSRNLNLTRTETKESLYDLGVSAEKPGPDLLNPPVKDPIFPEEYRLETETGLVKLKTLESLGRTRTAPQSRSERPSTEISKEKETEDKQGEEGLEEDIEFVTFTTGDPENPHNWSAKVRWLYTLILSVMVICASYGSDCLAGGLGTINDKFHVSTEVSTLSVSLFVLGFGVGSIVWSPLSEQPFAGRRIVYAVSFGLYTIFNIPCAVAKNIGTVLVCRLLCGCFAASALAIVGASIVDLHNETRGLAIALFSFCPYSGPVVGVLCNGFISVNTKRYEMMIWVNMAFCGALWILVCLIPETYAPSILKSKAARLRKESGNPKIMTEQEASPLPFLAIVNMHLLRPIKFIVQEPLLMIVCLYIVLIYSLLYGFFFAYPVIFSQLYGYKDDKIGMMYIPILIGAIAALAVTPILESKYNTMSKRRTPTPEDRLMGAMIGAPFPCISLFILGATSEKNVIWVGPASSGLAFGFGMVLLYYSLNNYILDSYARVAASALGTKVITRSAGGAAFPLFTTQMYHGLGLHWASWLLAFVFLAMIIIPFVFYKWGNVLRKKLCKEDYSAMVI